MITYNGFFLVRKPFFAGKKPQKPFFPQQKRTYLKRSIKFSPIFNGDYNSLCPFIPPKRNHAEIRSPKVEILAPDRSQDLIPVVVGGLTHQISPAHLTQISEKNKIKGERWSWFSDVIGAPRICQPSSFWRVLIGTMCSLPSPEKKQKRDWLVGTCFYQMMVQFQFLVFQHGPFARSFPLGKPTKQPPWAFWLENVLKKTSLNLPNPRVL